MNKAFYMCISVNKLELPRSLEPQYIASAQIISHHWQKNNTIDNTLCNLKCLYIIMFEIFRGLELVTRVMYLQVIPFYPSQFHTTKHVLANF